MTFHNPALSAQLASIKAARARMKMDAPVMVEKPKDLVRKPRQIPVKPLDAANRKQAETREKAGREEAERIRQQLIADRKAFLEARSSGNQEMRAIVLATARHFGVPAVKVMSNIRMAKVTLPRQIAMYLAKELTDNSYPAIGRRFQRDHSTVVHSYQKIESLLAKGNPVVTLAVAAVKDALYGAVEDHFWGS